MHWTVSCFSTPHSTSLQSISRAHSGCWLINFWSFVWFLLFAVRTQHFYCGLFQGAQMEKAHLNYSEGFSKRKTQDMKWFQLLLWRENSRFYFLHKTCLALSIQVLTHQRLSDRLLALILSQSKSPSEPSVILFPNKWMMLHWCKQQFKDVRHS